MAWWLTVRNYPTCQICRRTPSTNLHRSENCDAYQGKLIDADLQLLLSPFVNSFHIEEKGMGLRKWKKSKMSRRYYITLCWGLEPSRGAIFRHRYFLNLNGSNSNLKLKSKSEVDQNQLISWWRQRKRPSDKGVNFQKRGSIELLCCTDDISSF